MNKKAIIWFRQDLRIHDNEAISDALQSTKELIPVFVFDERTFKGKTRYGFHKTGRYRSKFIIDSIKDLRASLHKRNLPLIVRIGKPEEIISEIAAEYKTSWVFCNRERTTEELYVQDQLELKLWTIGQEVRYSRGKMLYYTADLPFPITHTPDTFTTFRKEVEKITIIREPIDICFDGAENGAPELEEGDIPELADFGFDQNFEPYLQGGESEALNRLNFYLWESKGIATYKETRNESEGMQYSSKFSSYLSQGCLSPKLIMSELKKFEKEVIQNESTYWMFFELLWRDFFRLMAKKYERKIFLNGGIKGTPRDDLSDNKKLFQIWSDGQTGYPFIDAHMRQLNATGFMSNRGRQNVASFLINNLAVNWQLGAEYFESLLIDYDPCSNWGNWNYLAGVGTDPREQRVFNVVKQSKKYDPEARLIRKWCPELNPLPSNMIHYPAQFSSAELDDYGIVLGKNYPKPIIKVEATAS
jgi:deoxyribodipyrimidine photo-lyase